VEGVQEPASLEQKTTTKAFSDKGNGFRTVLVLLTCCTESLERPVRAPLSSEDCGACKNRQKEQVRGNRVNAVRS
jgi:hypothetical protein